MWSQTEVFPVQSKAGLQRSWDMPLHVGFSRSTASESEIMNFPAVGMPSKDGG